MIYFLSRRSFSDWWRRGESVSRFPPTTTTTTTTFQYLSSSLPLPSPNRKLPLPPTTPRHNLFNKDRRNGKQDTPRSSPLSLSLHTHHQHEGPHRASWRVLDLSCPSKSRRPANQRMLYENNHPPSPFPPLVRAPRMVLVCNSKNWQVLQAITTLLHSCIFVRPIYTNKHSVAPIPPPLNFLPPPFSHAAFPPLVQSCIDPCATPPPQQAS